MADEPKSSAENGLIGDPGTGRGSDGRFLPGNRGGPGRPRSERALRRSEIFASAWTDDDLRSLGEKLKGMALAGDLTAARLVLDHLCGRPVAADVRDEIEQLSEEVNRLLQEDEQQ